MSFFDVGNPQYAFYYSPRGIVSSVRRVHAGG